MRYLHYSLSAGGAFVYWVKLFCWQCQKIPKMGTIRLLLPENANFIDKNGIQVTELFILMLYKT